MTKRKTKLNYFKPFGYKCFVLNNGKNELGKFDPRSDKEVFVGYSSTSKAYRIYNKKRQYMEESIHIVFDETKDTSEGDLHDDSN